VISIRLHSLAVMSFILCLLSVASTAFAQHWQVNATENNMSILVREARLNEEILTSDDEVGVFTTGDILAGATVIDVNNPNYPMFGLAAWEDDAGVEGIQGFSANEEISIKIYEHATDQEWNAEAFNVTDAAGNQADLIYRTNDLLLLSLRANPIRPRLILSERQHDFDRAPMNQITWWDFTITNTGNTDLVVDSITSNNQVFTCDINQGFTLTPQQQRTVRVTFDPPHPGYYMGELTITSNNPGAPIIVHLSGTVPMVIDVPNDFDHIQDAIDATQSEEDSIKVAAGVYTENINFNGKNITLLGNPDYPDSVVIDGNGAGTVVKFVNGEMAAANLNGFTLRHGIGEYYVLPFSDDSVIAGGGIRIEGASPVLQNLIVTEDSAAIAGGVFCSGDCSPVFENVRIKQNYATDGGGLCVFEEANATFRNCSFTENSANAHGGAIVLASSSRTSIYGSIFIANHSATAGVIWNSDEAGRAALYVDHCTFYGNRDTSGMGVLGGNGFSQIINTIVWGNSGTALSGEDLSVRYSDVQENHDGEGNINSDPAFVDAENGNFNLTENSPCINTGDPNSPLDPDNTRSDMGAFPYSPAASVKPSHSASAPNGYSIQALYPNPFNHSIRIMFDLPTISMVQVGVFDLSGRLLTYLVQGQLAAGRHEAVWNAVGFTSGIYLVKMETPTFSATKKVTLVK